MFRRMHPVASALLAIGAALLTLPAPAAADEGMWTFDTFPADRVGAKYGFTPDRAWLERVERASVRLAGGCSGSFVSPQGLVMTNHHCAHSCIEQLSTAARDYVASGFTAAGLADEVRCPEIEVNQLVGIADVTGRVNAATRGLADKAFNEAQKAELSQIEKECATSQAVRCDVVSLYHGGRFHLYTYRRFQDVRLVFAPELAIAFFGGDPDNFNFPRYDLDLSLLRVYQEGKPAKVDAFLPFAPRGGGPKDGDLVFVSGNPGRTSRLTPVSQLEFERDVRLPQSLFYASELRGLLTQFQTESVEHKRISGNLLFSIENSLKARKGQLHALVEPAFFGALVAREKELRSKVDSDPAMKQAYGGAWEAIRTAMVRYRGLREPYSYLEEGRGFFSDSFRIARGLVRSAEELPKPNAKRLREFAESNVPALEQELFSPAPIHDELEIATLSFSLTKLREALGPDDAVVQKVLGKKSPRELATGLVKGTKLRSVKLRRALFAGGRKAVEASEDPMIRLARLVDPDARAVRKVYEDEVEAPVKRNGELIAEAHFKLYGTSTYPDATFSPRLSYGAVRGWQEPDRTVPALTFIEGAFARATGRDPFRLPASWLRAKGRLALQTPMNLATTNDIIGGNSGSPLINARGEAAGLIFDGNIHSLAGNFGYDAALNRAVAVHSDAILEALEKIYGATRLVEELAAPTRQQPAPEKPGRER